MKSDRSANSVARLRRAFQRLNVEGFGFGNGLIVDTETDEVSIDLATNSGLGFVTAQLTIDLDTNSGLALGAGGITIDLDGTTLTLGAGGISVTAPEGRWTVTAIQTGNYNAVIGELVRCDPSSAGFTVTLPTAVSLAGRQIAVKNTTSSANAITFNTTGGQTIDGAASGATSIAAGFGSRVFVSDGANWMVVV